MIPMGNSSALLMVGCGVVLWLIVSFLGRLRREKEEQENRTPRKLEGIVPTKIGIVKFDYISPPGEAYAIGAKIRELIETYPTINLSEYENHVGATNIRVDYLKGQSGISDDMPIGEEY